MYKFQKKSKAISTLSGYVYILLFIFHTQIGVFFSFGDCSARSFDDAMSDKVRAEMHPQFPTDVTIRAQKQSGQTSHEVGWLVGRPRMQLSHSGNQLLVQKRGKREG